MQEKIVTGKDIAERMKNVKHKIAVTSGKGGVGKSTVAALLAVHYARKGYKVGIFDADFLGPSIPKLFGVEDKAKELIIRESGVSPVYSEKYGIKILSIQFMLPSKESPVIWRGLAINTALRSFLGSVDWEELDYLIFDTPPGTGDAILTVMDFVDLDGLIMVTIPQELSAQIVEKAINMAKKMDTDVLGIVENMSYFECTKCGERYYLFGKSRAVELARKYDIDLIAEIPYDMELLDLAERGRIEDYEVDYFEYFYI
ncbi:Mrp/NBP35 family ATP-binding protein [Archaeoglobus veneficus]|uniref:Iron-sulfur cluster carrier protein n=1 Tax=Archaeoglobus veneficus (strain DSM 11195 / SNP6) TaxID=693661 RepID=F2KPH2_ARCVS|nr:Mrp/NBP35 family ATP-binding protein [Archaeoglobus veneficus]AEA46403.1 ATPase-like, ParA/MinD [Archaeoglobus veneficus SNP6]